jgi:hypothetical protein
MAYFKCDYGKLYHPFGKGGRDVLLESLGLDQGEVAEAKDTIKRCPYFTLPISTEGAGMKSIAADDLSNGRTQLLDAPLVVSCPTSESAKIFQQMATDVIHQIFLQQVESNFVSPLLCLASFLI